MWYPTIDIPAIVSGLAAAIGCGLVGNFLLLRKQAMLSDAISHSVFLGIVAGYLLGGSLGILTGSLVAAVATIWIIHLLVKKLLMDSQVAVGVTFTAMFALGVLLLEQSNHSLHLDVEDALYGYLEGTIWPELTRMPFGVALLATMPYEVAMLLGAMAVAMAVVVFYFKELVATTFDGEFAKTLRLKDPSLVLLAATALIAVAGFNAVGAVLIVSMFVCPAAAASCLSDNLKTRLILTTLLATMAVLLGYALAVTVPLWTPLEYAISSSGSIALMLVLTQLAAMLWTRHRVC